ncbi:hypothetical protein ACR6HW_17585 [Fusibacter sp. JL298sf-3]
MRLTKKDAVAACCVLLLGLFLTLTYFCSKTPFQYLQSKDGETKAVEPLYETVLEDGNRAIFFFNAHGKVSLAVLRKTLLSYKLLHVGDEVPVIGTEEVVYQHTAYKDKGTYRWIDWGVVRKASIEKVLIQNEEATIMPIKPYAFRICYLTGEGTPSRMPSRVAAK